VETWLLMSGPAGQSLRHPLLPVLGDQAGARSTLSATGACGRHVPVIWRGWHIAIPLSVRFITVGRSPIIGSLGADNDLPHRSLSLDLTLIRTDIPQSGNNNKVSGPDTAETAKMPHCSVVNRLKRLAIVMEKEHA
jgi:hypothetical protein